MTGATLAEQRQLARRLHARGLSLREVGRHVGCSHEIVRRRRPLMADVSVG